MAGIGRRRLVNVRIFTAAWLALALGIVCSVARAYYAFDGVYSLIPAAAVLCIFIVVTAVNGFGRGAVCCLIALAFFLIGLLSARLYYLGYTAAEIPLGTDGLLSGRVEETGTTSSGGIYLILSGAQFDGRRIGGKVIAYLSDGAGDYCRAGYLVKVRTELFSEQFFADGQISYRAVSGIKYSCSVQSGLEAEYAFSLAAEIRNAVRDRLYSNLDEVTASVAYAMLTGDSSGISDAALTSFRYGGIAHIFAVSGLHIGVIYAAINFALRRVNRYISAVVSVTFVIFYAGVCSFTPSSVRAAIMCATSAALSLFGRRYDSLNALSLAATILLLINPVYLFDTGFILSFSAVGGIVCLKYRIYRLLKFLPKRLAGALSVSLSAQVGSFAALMASFGYVSAAGLFLNVLVLPAISAFYVLLAALTALCVIMPFIGAALAVVCSPMQAFINLMTACGFENSLISGWNGTFTASACVLAFVCLTDKLNLHAAFRAALCMGAVACAVSAAVIPAINPSGFEVTFLSSYSGGAAIISSPQGKVFIFTESYYGRTDAPDSCAAVMVGDCDDLSTYFNLGADFDSLYIDAGSAFSWDISGTSVISSSSFSLCGTDFVFEDGDLVFTCDGVTFAVSFGADGGVYDMPEGVDIYLAATPDGANVLTADGCNFLPSVSGNLTFRLSGGNYRLALFGE